VGHVVHSSASEARTSMHYFSCSCGHDADSIKSVLGHVTSNLCFYIWWDSIKSVTLCIPVRPRREMSTNSFSC
jgi:hypothetical protein